MKSRELCMIGHLPLLLFPDAQVVLPSEAGTLTALLPPVSRKRLVSFLAHQGPHDHPAHAVATRPVWMV
jgi:hypothetical protein